MIRPFEKNVNLTIIGPTRTLKLKALTIIDTIFGPTKVERLDRFRRPGLLVEIAQVPKKPLILGVSLTHLVDGRALFS